MTVYDWFLLVGVIYTGIGSDLLLNWGAGLITGKRLRADGTNWLERAYYNVHARNDPNMRADAPIDGPADRIPAWNHGLAVANGSAHLYVFCGRHLLVAKLRRAHRNKSRRGISRGSTTPRVCLAREPENASISASLGNLSICLRAKQTGAPADG